MTGDEGWKPDYPQRIKALRDLYASLPKIKCKGLCHGTCRSKIVMSVAEKARIEMVTGKQLPEWLSTVEGAPCPLLRRELDNRCDVYQIRPMICRVWGLGGPNSQMGCHFGCEPEHELTDVEILDLLAQSFELGGESTGTLDVAEVRRVLADPEQAAQVAAPVALDRRVMPRIVALLAEHSPDTRPGSAEQG